MKSEVHLSLRASPEQHRKLAQLQQAFAQVCNALAPVVQETRVWNRVALHHLTYRRLRAQFPDLGSQMVCNAIYAVSRSSRLVYQTPNSPFHHSRLRGQALPLLQFTDQCPVYFDRHTLSIKAGMASMFTLDGRIRFELALSPEVEKAFRERKLWEILLTSRQDVFVLTFRFHQDAAPAEELDTAQRAPTSSMHPPFSPNAKGPLAPSASGAAPPVHAAAMPISATASIEWPSYLTIQVAA